MHEQYEYSSACVLISGELLHAHLITFPSWECWRNDVSGGSGGSRATHCARITERIGARAE